MGEFILAADETWRPEDRKTGVSDWDRTMSSKGGLGEKHGHGQIEWNNTQDAPVCCMKVFLDIYSEKFQTFHGYDFLRVLRDDR